MTKPIIELLPQRRSRGFTPESMRTEDMRCRVTPARRVAVDAVARKYREQGVNHKSDVMNLALENLVFQMTTSDPELAEEIRRALKAEALPVDHTWLAGGEDD
jgi:hypothetical protein